MAEENKGIRLKKAATEFNVGVNTVLEFLAKKGHSVENNPNTRLSAEQYELVAAAFQAERAVKEQAEKIEIISSGNNVVIEAEKETKIEETEEVIIKNYNATNLDSKGSLRPAETATTPDEPQAPQADAETEPVPAPEPEPEPEPVQETEPEPAKEEPESGAEAPVFEPTQVGDLRIINKIDLDAINSKMRPDKKKRSKGEKNQPKAEAPKAEPKAKEAKPQPEAPKVEPKTEPAPAPS